MTDLRSTLSREGAPTELLEFACDLVDLLELDESLGPPYASVARDHVELIWEVPPRRVCVQIHTAGRYRYQCEDVVSGEDVGDEVCRRELVHVLRNLTGWLLEE